MKSSYLLTLMLICTPAIAATTPTLQYLKDCKLVKQRAMTAEEATALQQLQQAEEKMHFLQQPLDEMQAKMKPQEQTMQQISSKVDAQARRGEIDDDLLEEQQRAAEELTGTVAIYQKDIDRVTEFSDELEKKANLFSDLVKKDQPKDSFDQIRILQSGEQNTSCDKGIFFNKSIDL